MTFDLKSKGSKDDEANDSRPIYDGCLDTDNLDSISHAGSNVSSRSAVINAMNDDGDVLIMTPTLPASGA